MKKFLSLIIGIVLSFTAVAQDNAFSFIDSYDKLEMLCDVMKNMCPMEIPGMGTCTSIKVTPQAFTMELLVMDEHADDIMSAKPAAMADNFLATTPKTDDTYQLIKAVTDLGLAYRIKFYTADGRSNTFSITSADLAKVAGTDPTPLDRLTHYINQMNDEFRASGENNTRAYFDDEYVYVELLYTDDDFDLLLLGTHLLDDDDKAETLKETFEENALFAQFASYAAAAGRGFAFKYLSPDKSEAAIINIDNKRIKEALSQSKIIK